MRVSRLEDFQRKELIEEIRKGAIFIYPTDTVYGIGCNALKKQSVLKIRKMKKTTQPFSIIAPTKQWIHKNLKVRHREQLSKLPGKYTLIFEKRRKGFLERVRMPKHAFTSLVKQAGVPFISTSVNISGMRHIKRVAKIPHTFLKGIDYVVDAGTLDGKPSRVIDLTGERPRTLR